jgi:hypothetical protein
MRRWLVAVLALHFFLSVGAFAFDKLPTPESFGGAAHSLVAERVAALSDPAPEAGQTGQKADRGLTDIQSELPEGLDVPIATSSRGEALRTPPAPLARDLTPPVLDGPQRPPRGPLAFA